MSDIGYSSDDSDAAEERVTLESINQRKTINSSLSSTYAAQWGPVEAFREIVQNWRDAIIDSFKLQERDFHVTREENENEILYTATAQSSSSRKPKKVGECLGFIRWSCQKKVGIVEVTNRQATLQPKNLDMGGTSKKNESTQAGIHGEGLKVALLVILRSPQNHAVICRSGGFKWNFNFSNQGKLFTMLMRMTPAAITKTRDQASKEIGNTLLPFSPVPNEDVQFFIGGVGRGRNEKGYPVDRSGVTKEEFKEWTKAAIFLQEIDQQHSIRTNEGDLITDERFSGRIYLKGLLLKESKPSKSASLTGLKLKYGYNFATGQTNRDRQSIATANEESRAILSIWGNVLDMRPTPTELIEEFHNMLNSKVRYADVAKAESYIKSSTADLLKNYLFSEQFKNKWYYCTRETSENPRFQDTVIGLEREPMVLEEPYWDVLKKQGFVRTAAEEERKRFQAAEVVSIPQEHFAKAIARLLRAALASCPQTKDMTLHFVDGGSLGLDSFCLWDQGETKIHARWLAMDRTLQELGLAADETIRVVDIVQITVKRLFVDILMQIPLSSWAAAHLGQRQPPWYRSQAIVRCEQNIIKNMRFEDGLKLFVRRTPGSDHLVVKWDAKSAWAPDTTIFIQAHHSSTCPGVKDRLTAKEFPTHRDCGNINCRSANVDFDSKAYQFSSMARAEDLFVLISNPKERDSFVVLAEDPVIDHTLYSPAAHPEQYFTQGDPIETLDVMAMDWFRGVNSTNGPEAALGIKKDQASNGTQKPRCKKRRIS